MAANLHAAGGESRPEQIEREAFLALVRRAVAKNQAHQPLTVAERKAWSKWERQEDEKRGSRFVAMLPKRVYSAWSGRPTKILHDQADLYGMPLRGATVNLLDLIRWLHDFFAHHKHELAPLAKNAGLVGGPATLKEALLREQVDLYRRKNELLEDQLSQRYAHLLPRAEVHQLHVQMATVLRAAGERLQKQFGPDAASILAVALDDFETMLDKLTDDTPDHAPRANPT